MSLVLSIGQCNFDHGRISETLRHAFKAEVVGADLVLLGATILAVAAAALLLLGIIVRINKGLHIDV